MPASQANFLSPLGLACLCCVLLTGVGALESPADSQAVASLGEAPDCVFQPSSVSISPSSPSDLFPFSFSLLCFSPINSSSISFGKSSYVQTKDLKLSLSPATISGYVGAFASAPFNKTVFFNVSSDTDGSLFKAAVAVRSMIDSSLYPRATASCSLKDAAVHSVTEVPITPVFTAERATCDRCGAFGLTISSVEYSDPFGNQIITNSPLVSMPVGIEWVKKPSCLSGSDCTLPASVSLSVIPSKLPRIADAKSSRNARNAWVKICYAAVDSAYPQDGGVCWNVILATQSPTLTPTPTAKPAAGGRGHKKGAVAAAVVIVLLLLAGAGAAWMYIQHAKNKKLAEEQHATYGLLGG